MSEGSEMLRRRATDMSEHLVALRADELAHLDNRLQAMRRLCRLLPERKVKPWTFFRVFRCSSNELAHSNVFAYLLNPAAPHGLGPLFLHRFVELEQLDIDPHTVDEQLVAVSTEVATGSRRADIVIDMDHSVIVIENKVYGSESKNQTSDLKQEVSAHSDYRDKEQYFVFLTPTGEPAGSPSFKAMSYQDIAGIVSSLSFGALRGVPPKTTALLADLQEHIEEAFGMRDKMWTLSQRGKMYLEFCNEIQELTQAYEEDVNQLIETAKRLALEVLSESTWTFESYKGYQQIYDKHWWGSPEWYIRFQLSLNGDSLARREVTFALLVDLQRRDEIMKLLDEDSGLQDTLRGLGSEYRPLHWKKAVAFKKYTFAEDLSDVEAVLRTAFDEHKFLVEKLNETLDKLV